MIPLPDSSCAAAELLGEFPQHDIVPFRSNGNLPGLTIMKFGGTSLADVSCIRRVVEIVLGASTKTKLLVVVSAMSGVTSKLVEAAELSAAKKRTKAAAIFEEIRERHEAVLSGLIHSDTQRAAVRRKLYKILREAEQICRKPPSAYTMGQRHDATISIGERLCAPIVAASLVSSGLQSEAVDATTLVVTDSIHGAANPNLEATRARCEERVRPILHRNVVPVVTGFIGATAKGAITTLGRNSSDYSATILAAALDASEVIIWTDVDGVRTADPRRVLGASSIPEISYREAIALAYFGAKVLHPRTFAPLAPRAIPVWIRNTFCPESIGTKITPGVISHRGSKALAVMDDVALIRVRSQGIAASRQILDGAVASSRACREDPILISRESSQHEIHIVVSRPASQRLVRALRHSLIRKNGRSPRCVVLDRGAALVTMVGRGESDGSHEVVRMREVLHRAGVKVIAAAQDSFHESVSVVVDRKDSQTALVALHREFRMGRPNFVPRANYERATRRVSDPLVPESARNCWAVPNVHRWTATPRCRKIIRPSSLRTL